VAHEPSAEEGREGERRTERDRQAEVDPVAEHERRREEEADGDNLLEERFAVHDARRLELLCLVDHVGVSPQETGRDRLEQEVDRREGDGVLEAQVGQDVLVLRAGARAAVQLSYASPRRAARAR